MRKLLSQALAAVLVLSSVSAYAAPKAPKKASLAKTEVVKDFKIEKKAPKAKELTVEQQKARVAKSANSQFKQVKALLPVVKHNPFREAAAPVVPPFAEDFTQTLSPDWTIIDSNGDGKTWTQSSNGIMSVVYNADKNMDDWLITPALQLEAGVMYPLTLDVWNTSNILKEKVEICLGTAQTADAMTTVVLEPTEITGTVSEPYQVEVNIVAPAAGVYYLGIHGCSDPDMYYLYVDNLSIGAATSYDGPVAIADLEAVYAEGTGVTVTMTAPTKTIGGDDLTSLDNVTLKCNGEVVKTWDNPTPGEALTYVDATAMGMLTYSATATNADGTSKEAAVNLFAGAIVPPFTEEFNNDSALEPWTIIDSNADQKTWTLVSGTMRIQYNDQAAMDDWLITPPIKVEGGKVYNVTLDVWGQSTMYIEKVEVKMGTAATVAAMTKTVIPVTDVDWTQTNAKTIQGFASAAEDGNIYIGIHGLSEPDQYYLYIDNVSVSAPIDGGAPQAVEDLTVTPDPNCELKATVAFTCPTLNIAEQPVEALTEAEIYREETLIATLNSISAGQAVSYVDEGCVNGVNNYAVIIKNAKGASVPAVASAFVGVNLPADVEGCAVAPGANDGQKILSWNPVTTTITGDPLAAQFITYNIYKATDDGIETVATGLTESSYTEEVCDADAAPDFYTYAVKAQTTAGVSANYGVFFFAAGAPEQLPWVESFADGTISHGLAASGDLSVMLATDETFEGGNPASADGDNGFLVFYDEYGGWLMPGSVGIMTLPIAIPADSNPALTFSVFNIAADDENSLDVIINGTTVRTIEPTEGDMEWVDYVVDLSAYKGQVINVELLGHLENYLYLMIDNIAIINVVDYEVLINDINAPLSVKPNEEFDINVKVQNAGSEGQAIDVTLYINGEEVETASTVVLEFLETQTLTFKHTFTPVDDVHNAVWAVASAAHDTDEDNNSSTMITVILSMPTYPEPLNLKAEDTDGTAVLTWSEPVASEGIKIPVTEDFENAEAWAHEVAGWTFIDEDGDPVGGVQDVDIPGITPGETTLAWMVTDFNSIESLANEAYQAHSGEHMLSNMFNWENTPNLDWMISPALCGDAQTISLYAKSLTTSYGNEKISLLYTEGAATDIESYVEVKIVSLPDEWNEYTFEVPDGAKYFAIKCVSQDAFMCFVDDITFIPADAQTEELELKGYNVYRDGQKINAEVVAETTYTDTKVEKDQTYTYAVTAVYSQGESAGSNVAEITITTTALNSISKAGVAINGAAKAIVVANAEGMAINVTTVDGKVIYNGVGAATTTIPATAGVYVVKAGKTVAKVVVR